MRGVYKSLKVRMRDTLQRGKTNSMALPRVNSASTLSLNDEMEELERIVAHRIGGLKAAIKEGEAVVANESQQAGQLVESLKMSITVLESKLAETEEALRGKDFSRQKMEEALVTKIQDLENDVKKKDQRLTAQGNEINELKAKIDRQLKEISELELVVEKAKLEAAGHAQHAEHLAETSQAKIAALESQLREAEELTRQRESGIKELEQKLSAKIHDFENLLRNKEELLAERNAKISDLQSQLKVLKKGIGEMSVFFRQAEVFAGIGRQNVNPAVLNEPADGGEEKPVTAPSNVPKVMPALPDAAHEIVSPEIIQCITSELAEVTGVMNPLALIIVREHVAALGESIEKFPKTRVAELLERLVQEISDKNLQSDFRERLAQNAQISGASGALS